MATYTHSATEPATAPATTGHTQLSVKAVVIKPAIKATTTKIIPDISALSVLLLSTLLPPSSSFFNPLSQRNVLLILLHCFSEDLTKGSVGS